MTEAQGEGYEHFTYTPYGEVWVEEHLSSRIHRMSHRFTGQELDPETGLYAFPARNYDPRTSRWLSADPALEEYLPAPGQSRDELPGMGGVFDRTNLAVYHYTSNNPLKYIDPTGESDIEGAQLTGAERYDPVTQSTREPTDTWKAEFVEVTLGAYFAAPEENAEAGLIGGISQVVMENERTGDVISAAYAFYVEDITGAGLTGGLSLEIGGLTGELPRNYSPEDVANSLTGPSNVANISGGPVSLTPTIRGGYWRGSSVGPAYGGGLGISGQRADYSLIEGSLRFTSGEDLRATPLLGSRPQIDVWRDAWQ